jgi:outer membrane protein OmpA-like peptidoglycan-associated protein
MLAAGAQGSRFAVTGYGDPESPDSQLLGRARALAVATALRRAGIPGGTIDAAGGSTGQAGAVVRLLP